MMEIKVCAGFGTNKNLKNISHGYALIVDFIGWNHFSSIEQNLIDCFEHFYLCHNKSKTSYLIY